MDYDEVKAKFTAYVKVVIQNTATDYRRKLMKTIEREISIEDFESLPRELLSYDDSSFSFEKDITYTNIEILFENEKYYKAMKNLSDKEKLVLYLTVVEEKKTEQVAEIMATTPNNVCQIKSRAVKKFLNKLSNMN